jgi:hydroxypyruvate isomerase
MPRLAANLTLLFNEYPFVERFAAAARAGFEAVECMFPYAHPAARLRDELERHFLKQALFNLPAGDWESGERGLACHPDRTAEFRDGVGRALEYAKVLGCEQLNCLVGGRPESSSRDTARSTLLKNLQYAAGELGRAGLRLLIEPVNTRDVPGFFLCETLLALELIDEVASPHLFLQYDVYHMQIMEGDLARTLERHLPRIAHIQIADVPGRHEPGTGEIRFPFLFELLDRLGYAGYVGCEYRPLTTTEAGLGWAAPYLRGGAARGARSA